MPPRNLAKLLSVLGPFLVLLFVTLLFAALLGAKDAASRHGDNPTEDLKNFFSTVNVVTILAQSVIVAIGALGMTLIIVSGGIDLSVGSVIALTSVTGAVLLRASWASGSALLVTVLAGGVVGLVNGALIAGLRMTPFIVTLGMLGIARGVAKWLADNATVNSDHITNSAIAGLMRDANWLGLALPPGVVIAFALAVLTAVVMRHTVFGRHIFAIGSNEATARLCGIRTRLVKIGLYSMAGLYFGLAGVMQLSRLRQGDPTAAAGLELDMIAAVVIGGASLSGGTGSILGAMIGALTMAVLRTGSQYMDWSNFTQEIIIGVLIILAVGLDRLRQGRTKS